MAISETQRRDLYTGLESVLGPEQADTLMTYLPADPTDLATKGDLLAVAADVELQFRAVGARFEAVDSRFDAVDSRFDAVDSRMDRMEGKIDNLRVGIDSRIDAIHSRLDRLFLTMGVGLVAMIVTVFTETVLR